MFEEIELVAAPVEVGYPAFNFPTAHPLLLHLHFNLLYCFLHLKNYPYIPHLDILQF